MPIAPLPPNAVRAIGSSQVLSDPASLVKELLDNAIDGQATRISIELSANTLDDIRVKDNGLGISPDDRAVICTRYCTSKIRDLYDLEIIGGNSLGFRGEALASATEMSGNLTITTRIEGEGTAVELKFDRRGQISGQKRMSHPVGTTVRVENFLRNLPVRRQAAEKTSMRMLTKVRKMLQSYALARPHLRLSLKILKAKDRKGDWTYPKSGVLSTSRVETSFNAASEIFGKKLTSECELAVSTWSSAGEQIDETVREYPASTANRDKAYTLEAVLAKPDCDISVLSNVGQYVSVDSRPVSCTRGTFKQIVSSYKSHLRPSAASGDKTGIVDPFLFLNICCPPASYDANVEPAKDDVLFADPNVLLEITGRWFHSVYGEVKPTSLKPSAKTAPASKPHGIELLLARERTPVESDRENCSPKIGTTFPASRSASSSTTQMHSISRPLPIPTSSSSGTAPLSFQTSAEFPGAMSRSATGPPATDQVQTEASPNLQLNHGDPTLLVIEESSSKPSSYAISVEKPVWRGSMYPEEEDDEEDFQTHPQVSPGSPVDLEVDGDEHLRDRSASNPWSFAKINAAMRPSARNQQLPTPARHIGDAGNSTDPSSDDLARHEDQSTLERPFSRVHQTRSSPEVAYPSPSPFPFPQKARGKRKSGNTCVDASLTPATSSEERHTHGALDTWVQRSLGDRDQSHQYPSTTQDEQDALDVQYSRDFISARSLPTEGTPLSKIPDASQIPQRKPAARKQPQANVEKQFVSPVNDPHRVWFDVGENLSQRRPQKQRRNRDNQGLPAAATLDLRNDRIGDDDSETTPPVNRSLPSPHPDLALTLDYEARKQKANETHRRALRERAAAAAAKLARSAPSDGPDPHHAGASSPHKNRQAKAIAALHNTPDPSSSPTAPASLRVEQHETAAAFEPSDPRAYLLRVHHRLREGQQAPPALPPQQGRSRRRKTALLPLETIADEGYTGDLTLVVDDVDVGGVEREARDGGAWDRYVEMGEVGLGFEKVGGECVKTWEAMLRDLVRDGYVVEGEEEEGARADVRMDLVQILQAHAAAERA